jgi:NAD(P)-dependent dehydrogenase (short-subunit alcohol dehydrogenase family)
MEFTGKTAVITGGATGIGFALAKQMGKVGARIILCEPREPILVQAVQALADLRIDAKYFVGDVAVASSVEALADFAWAENGRADILVNNAGVAGPRGGVLDMDLSAARALFDINFYGAWNGVQTFGRRYRDDGLPAAIYTTASENALFNALPAGHGAAYVPSKHAVLALMDVFRREAAASAKLADIEMGVIIPGWVATPMTRDMGMDADAFTARILTQMQAGEYYLVGHSYNVVRIAERQAEIAAAYARYAPRYDGDEEFDVQLSASQAMSARSV